VPTEGIPFADAMVLNILLEVVLLPTVSVPSLIVLNVGVVGGFPVFPPLVTWTLLLL